MKLFLLLAVVASAVAVLAGQARATTPGCYPQSERVCLVGDGGYQVAGSVKGSATCHFGKGVDPIVYRLNGCKPAAPVKKAAKPGLEVKRISVTFEKP